MEIDSVDEMFRLAVEHHGAGRDQEVISLCRHIIELTTGHAAAWDLLGVSQHRLGQSAEAARSLRRAAALDPGADKYMRHLGIVLAARGRFRGATIAFCRAADLRPGAPANHYFHGRALHDRGRLQNAIAAYRKALAIRPNYPEAVRDAAAAHNQLGVALAEQGQFDQAVAEYREAIALNPNFAEAYNNLGTALQETGRHDEAFTAYRTALLFQPGNAIAHNNVGTLCRDVGRLEEAIEAHRRALSLQPDFAEGYNNLGNALKDTGELELAEAAYREAIRIRPSSREARFNLAFVLLLRGKFEEGWAEFEYRRELLAEPSDPPRWNGDDLGGRPVILHTTEGLGDIIQFIRYAPLIAARNGQVLLRCPPQLYRLLICQGGVAGILCDDTPIPPGVSHHPLLSLPRLFGTRLDSIPIRTPYLSADPARAEVWRHTLGPRANGTLRVGLNWAGNSQPKSNRRRTIGLSAMTELANVPGVTYHGLQQGEAAREAQSSAFQVVTHPLPDMSDTAALVANLDLVITCDTSVAHLAGALGVPVWVALPHAADWRWMNGRDDSPWYPAMTLFRQPSPGDWHTPMATIADRLRKLSTDRIA